MIDSSLLQIIEHWGYYLLPKTRDCSPGFGGLLVAIREQPTQLHFDPEMIELRFADQGDASWTMLRLNTPFHGTRQVLAGRVMVCDRLEKRIPFFTFGAALTASYAIGEVIYAFRSSAPVLQIEEDFNAAASQLYTEAEVLIGLWQAHYGRSEAGLNRLMSQLDPCVLYQMCLQRLMKRYAQQPGLRVTCYGSYTTLREECDWLRGNQRWQTVDPLEPFRLPKN
jgi:hypothetical protein